MVIIGKGGRYITEADALDHVFGYTLFNDGSVRDFQHGTHRWTPGKNFDNTGAIGPEVITPDELPDGAVGLKIASRIGDEILQSATTSEYSALDAGDMIAMGTPPAETRAPEHLSCKTGENNYPAGSISGYSIHCKLCHAGKTALSRSFARLVSDTAHISSRGPGCAQSE